MFTDDPLDRFEVESFDLDPMRIVTYKMEEASISGEGFAALRRIHFSLNAGKVSRHTTERLDSFVDAIAGKRITYAQLTKGKTWFDAEDANATF